MLSKHNWLHSPWKPTSPTVNYTQCLYLTWSTGILCLTQHNLSASTSLTFINSFFQYIHSGLFCGDAWHKLLYMQCCALHRTHGLMKLVSAHLTEFHTLLLYVCVLSTLEYWHVIGLMMFWRHFVQLQH